MGRFRHLFLSSFFSLFFFPLWKTVRYRLKYCLNGPLIPNNQPTSLYSYSAIKVHDSQAFRTVTRQRINFIFHPSGILLSFQPGCSFFRAALACTVLDITSGFEPSSETIALRYLKLITIPIFSLLNAINAFCLTSSGFV